MRRVLTWVVTLPLAAASVLLGHALAYRVTGAPAGDLHGYLEHAPQVVLVLGFVAVVTLAFDTRSCRRSPLPLATMGVVAFVLQEHLERLLHTGQVPYLLTSPVLWLGVALQLPLAAVIWMAAREVARDIARRIRRAGRALARIPLVPAPEPPLAPVPVRARRVRTRGPPHGS